MSDLNFGRIKMEDVTGDRAKRFHCSCSLPNAMTVVEWKRTRWVGNAANGLRTIKKETQLNADSRKVRGCLISRGVGGTVQQWRNVRRRYTSGPVALVLCWGVTFAITLLYNNQYFNTPCDISDATSNDWPWSRERNGKIYIHMT
jgi:hypothetical protein